MFIANKPCKFAGLKFKSGEEIPAKLILPKAVNRLKRLGLIAEVGEAGSLLPPATSIEDGSPEDTLPPEGTLSTEAELMKLRRHQRTWGERGKVDS